jgi:hypothetical protein
MTRRWGWFRVRIWFRRWRHRPLPRGPFIDTSTWL